MAHLETKTHAHRRVYCGHMLVAVSAAIGLAIIFTFGTTTKPTGIQSHLPIMVFGAATLTMACGIFSYNFF